MTRRLRHWLRCPTCGGRFGRHDLSDFLAPPPHPDPTGQALWGFLAERQAHQDRGTSG